MSDKTAALMASARLEGVIQSFLDARVSGQRDLAIRGGGVVLGVFRGNGLLRPRETKWDEWGFAGGTVLSAFRALQVFDVSYHRGFWMSPALKQFNWYIHESSN